MKRLAILLVVLVVLGFIMLPQALFKVDETEVAIVTRFGAVQRSIQSPGLNTKTPFIETVTRFDRRLLIFDAALDSLITKDKKRLDIDVYARGRIIDPKLFRETVRTVDQGSSRAADIVRSELRREIGSYNQSEVITTQREYIMSQVKAGIAPKLEGFGLEIVDVRIKRADFPAEVTASVFARMQAERKRIADRERAEGAEVDLRVRAEVDREATVILAEAERDANIIRGNGEAEAIQIYAGALEQSPEFYSFQRSLQAYKLFFDENTTVVLPADSDLFRFLQSSHGGN